MQKLTFHDLTISFDDQVLAPRAWTVAQSTWAAQLLAEGPPGPALELCAGVGHIGLGAVRDSDRRLVMVDVNSAAERFALENAAANGMGTRVEFRVDRIDAALHASERFGLIIADPPWVRSTDTSMFPEDPVLAIDGGDDGLDLARTCVDLIDRHLCTGGAGILQLGNIAQAESMAAYAADRPAGSLRAVQTRVYERGVLMHLAR